MSLENAARFALATAKDARLASQLTAAVRGKPVDEAAAAFAALAATNGYQCTADEATRMRATLLQAVQLSQEDLEAVAGGTGGGQMSRGIPTDAINAIRIGPGPVDDPWRGFPTTPVLSGPLGTPAWSALFDPSEVKFIATTIDIVSGW